jgi:hypothetical protein
MSYTAQVPLSAVPFGGLVLDPGSGSWLEAGAWQPPGRWFGDGAMWSVRAVEPAQLVTMLVPEESDAIGMFIAAGFTTEVIR